jgi:hypothetical protein
MAIDTSLPISNKGTNGSPITDSGGNPVQGVEVTLWRRALNDSNSDGEGDEITDTKLLARTQSDSNGEFEFTENDLPVTYVQGDPEVIYYCTVHAIRVEAGSGDPLDNGRIKTYNATNEPEASDYMAAYSLEQVYPSSVIHSYVAEGFASPWTDNVGSKDMSIVGGVSQSTFSNGETSVTADGTDDYGTIPGISDIPGRDKEFGIAFTIQYDDSNIGTFEDYVFGVDDDATNVFGVLLGTGTGGVISLNLRSSGDLLTVETQNKYGDGTPHAVVINKTGNDASDIDIYVDDMSTPTSDVDADDQGFSPSNYNDPGRETTVFCRNKGGNKTAFSDIDIGVLEFNSDAYTQDERDNFVTRRPEV